MKPAIFAAVIASGIVGTGSATDGPNGHPILRLCYMTRSGRCTGEGPWTQQPGIDGCGASVLHNRQGVGDAVWIDDSIGTAAERTMLACEIPHRPRHVIFVGVAQGHRPPPRFPGAEVIAEFYPVGGTPPRNFWHQSIRQYWGCPPKYGLAGFLTQAKDFHWVGASPPTARQARQEWQSALSCIPRGERLPLGAY